MPSRIASLIAAHVSDGLVPVTSRGPRRWSSLRPQVRAIVRQILEPQVPGVAVLGYNEVVRAWRWSRWLSSPPQLADAMEARAVAA